MMSRNVSGPSQLHRAGLRQRRGYAMGLFLVVLTVLTTTVVMLMSTAASESRNAYRQEQITDAKLTGMAALDSFYARLQSVKDFPLSTSDPNIRADVNPLGATPAWFRLVDGAVVTCEVGESLPCYQLSTDLGSGKRSPVVVVTAKVRHTCRGGSCSYLYLNQRLRAWQFTDFLFYTQYNVISPGFAQRYQAENYFPDRLPGTPNDACAKNFTERRAAGLGEDQCPVIAYGVNDKITGPVYTADDFVAVCGDPATIFTNPSQIYSYNTGRTVPPPNPIEGGTTAVTGDAIQSASFRGDNCPPVSVLGKKVPFQLRLPPVRTTFEQAKAVARSGYAVGCSATFTFRNKSVLVSSPCRNGELPLLDGDVVTVDGDLTITGGVVEGKVSVFARKGVRIKGSLTYPQGSLRDGAGNPTGSVLGINAGEDIVLESTPRPAGEVACVDDSKDFFLDALLVSLGGTVYDDNLGRQIGAGERAQCLKLRGAIATKYQGVFGLYDAATGSTGTALAGFKKDFEHDSRSAQDISFLPPYLVTPSGLQWIRLDLAEVYCRNGDGVSCS